MTQQAVIAPAPAPLAPSASEAGEPTIEELAKLVGDPIAEPVSEEAAPAVESIEPVVEAETETVEEAEPVVAPDVDAALERATKAAERARAGSKRYAETQKLLADRNAQALRVEREAAQLRQENAAAKAREEALLKDPYKALKDRGMTDVDLAQRAMRENTPEAATARLEEALNTERAARVALEQRLHSERQAMARQQAETSFVHVADNEDAYPRLSQLNAGAQLTVARAALAQIRANGHDETRLNDAQVAEACEMYLAPKRVAKAKPVPEAPASVVRPAAPKASGKTLTNAQAQTRTVAPSGWDTLSEEQQLAHIAASLPDPVG